MKLRKYMTVEQKQTYADAGLSDIIEELREHTVQNYNLDTVGDPRVQELIDLIHEIKRHKEPPYREDDPYCMRYPWQKLGSVSSGICMAWWWYWDNVILEKATKDDLLAAIAEYKTNLL